MATGPLPPIPAAAIGTGPVGAGPSPIGDPAAPGRQDRMKWLLAAIVVVLLLVGGGIVLLLQDDDDPTPTPAAPAPSAAAETTTTEPGASSTTDDGVTTPTDVDPGPSTTTGEPQDPTVPTGLPEPDPEASASALQAIAAGPARASEFATPAIDGTLIQFGQAICLSTTGLKDGGADAATLSSQLVTTRDELASSSAAIWADPAQAPDGYARVIYYGTKFLCPDNLPYADAAFPTLAGT